jgi:hypothetical protein
MCVALTQKVLGIVIKIMNWLVNMYLTWKLILKTWKSVKLYLTCAKLIDSIKIVILQPSLWVHRKYKYHCWFWNSPAVFPISPLFFSKNSNFALSLDCKLQKSHYRRTFDKANLKVATDGGALKVWHGVSLFFWGYHKVY